MRLDLLIIILGLLLAAAMILTLIYGKEYSRHGYGRLVAAGKDSLASATHVPTQPSAQGAPCRIG